MFDPYPSPLRYPGGKGKLANYVRLLMQENGFVGYTYVEPYAGGAAVALGLLFDHHADRIIINDADPAIYWFWRCVTEQADELCRRISATAINMETWRRQREVMLSTGPDPLDLAFATFFLNRTNRSGILLGGVVGGKDQTGPWKIDARFVKAPLLERIEKIAAWSSRITVYQLDAEVFLHTVVPTLPATTLLYLDPPYVGKGADLYKNYYSEQGHRSLATVIRAEARPWIVSYDDVPLVREIYQGERFLSYGLSYSAQSRRQGGEIMFFSQKVGMPATQTPPQVSRRDIVAAANQPLFDLL